MMTRSVAEAGDAGVNNAVRMRQAWQDDAASSPLSDSIGAAPCRDHQAGFSSPVERSTDCEHLPFVIRRDGSWLYRGSVIGRKELVCLFASVLTRDAAGEYWLRTPVERGRIAVEDVPFVAVELDFNLCPAGNVRDQVLTFRTNVDQLVTADCDHPIRVAHDILTCEPTPYLRVRDGEGGQPIEARISRAVYYELVALAVPKLVHGRRMLGVWSCRRFFPLGEMPTD
jgi:hypothetical protein